MKACLFSIPLLVLAITVKAEEIEGIDYCHNDKINQDWLKMITDYPEDAIILKLAGLREGLCIMIDRGQITHEQGVDIWEDERQRSMVDRGQEQAERMPKYTL